MARNNQYGDNRYDGYNSRNNNSQPQGFDTAIFNEVRPTYVGPPIEAYQSNIDTLTNAMDVNQTAATKLDDTFSTYKTQLNKDPIGLAKINEYQQKFASVLDNAVARGGVGLAYINTDIRKAVNELAKDSNVKNRIGLQATWEGQRDAAIKDAKTSTEARRIADKWNIYNPDYDDNTGIAGNINYRNAVNEVDLTAIVSKVNKDMIANINPASGVSFIDINGNRTTDPKLAIAMVDGNGKKESVSFDRLYQGYRTALKNDPNAVSSIIQGITFNQYSKDGKTNPFELQDDMNVNPDKYIKNIGTEKEPIEGDAIDKVAMDYAKAFMYNQNVSTVNSKEFDVFGQWKRTVEKTTEPDTEETSFNLPAGTNPGGITRKSQLSTSRNAVNNYKDNSFKVKDDGSGNVIPVTQYEKDKVFNSQISGNINDIYSASKESGQNFTTILSSRPSAIEAYNKAEIAKQRGDKVAQEINKANNDKFSVLFGSPKYPELAYIKEKGFDWTKEEGSSPEVKIENTVKKFNKYRENLWVGNSTREERIQADNIYEGITKQMDDKKTLAKEFNKKYDVELGKPNAASNANATTAKPLYTSDRTNKNVIDAGEKLIGVITMKSALDAMVKEDIDFTRIDDSNKKSKQLNSDISNLLLHKPEVKISSTDHPVNGNPKSIFVSITGKLDIKSDSEPVTREFYIGVGEGGIKTELYNDLLKDNPEWQAEQLVNQVSINNAASPEGYTPSLHKNVKFIKGRDVNGKIGDESYQVDNGNGFETTDKKGAISAVTSNITLDNILFKARLREHTLARSFSDDSNNFTSGFDKLRSILEANSKDRIKINNILGRTTTDREFEEIINYIDETTYFKKYK